MDRRDPHHLRHGLTSQQSWTLIALAATLPLFLVAYGAQWAKQDIEAGHHQPSLRARMAIALPIFFYVLVQRFV